jgi:hypothetical protein
MSQDKGGFRIVQLRAPSSLSLRLISRLLNDIRIIAVILPRARRD